MAKEPIHWDELEGDNSLNFEKSAWKSSRRRRAHRGKSPRQEREDKPALVLSVGAKRCTVQGPAGTRIECRLPTALAARQKSALAVGDQVDLVLRRGAHWIDNVRPRTTELSRPDPRNPRRRRVLAANIETVIIVVAVRRPGIKAGLIDRYLLAASQGGARPLICVNKIDLLEPGSHAELDLLVPYRDLGYEVALCSAESGEGLEGLLELIEGELCVLAGHSGVGKSSLLNALVPSLDLATQSVRPADGTGRHTTTRSGLFELPGGTRIIDTPGIRELGLWEIGPEDLAGMFEEFRPFSSACRFANCTHTHEPECGVKEALLEGKISRQRYEAYCRIRESLQSAGHSLRDGEKHGKMPTAHPDEFTKR